MTVKEYIEKNSFKPLSAKEIEDMHKVKISGTDNPMPWTEVFTRLSAGMEMDDVVYIYGNARKIALFAQREGVDADPVLSKVVDDEILQRRKMNEIELNNPVVARTMKEMVNEYAPDVGRDVAILSKKVVKRATNLVDDDECSAADLKNITAAIQTMTDTLEITQRHSAGVTVNNGDIQVNGFEFKLDTPPDPIEVDVIEVDGDK